MLSITNSVFAFFRKVSVSINMPEGGSDKPDKIKRRQTGFVRPQDLAEIRLFNKGSMDDEEDEDDEDSELNIRYGPCRWKTVVDGAKITYIVNKNVLYTTLHKQKLPFANASL